jgi:hypothetical protein
MRVPADAATGHRHIHPSGNGFVRTARVIFGIPPTRSDMATYTAAAVDIFLRGCGFDNQPIK